MCFSHSVHPFLDNTILPYIILKIYSRDLIYSILGGFVVKSLPRGIICAVAFYLGTPVMNRVLEAIPEFVQNGLVAAAGLIPALGIALLAQMILSKKTMVYFILGFALAAYLKIPMLGIAMMAGCLAVILVQMQGTQKVAVQEVEDDDF
ncbi:PTS sugar transporter subunit IIC [Mediterraneibacter gnavus]|uniref:PTS sugar transporter subunit IIC n=1 Tax=Mediterraneibacter gnavus TaxID=33038 RepID=UPI0032198C0C